MTRIKRAALAAVVLATLTLSGCADPRNGGGGGGGGSINYVPRQGGALGGGWHDSDWYTGRREALAVTLVVLALLMARAVYRAARARG